MARRLAADNDLLDLLYPSTGYKEEPDLSKLLPPPGTIADAREYRTAKNFNKAVTPKEAIAALDSADALLASVQDEERRWPSSNSRQSGLFCKIQSGQKLCCYPYKQSIKQEKDWGNGRIATSYLHHVYIPVTQQRMILSATAYLHKLILEWHEKHELTWAYIVRQGEGRDTRWQVRPACDFAPGDIAALDYLRRKMPDMKRYV